MPSTPPGHESNPPRRDRASRQDRYAPPRRPGSSIPGGPIPPPGPSSSAPEEIIRIRTNTVHVTPYSRSDGSVWALIREQRAAAGLSTAQLAARAHLSELTVEAIEAGAIERLPIGEAGRREVAALCRVLELDPEPFLHAMRDTLRSPFARGLERQRPISRRSRVVAIGTIWVLLLAALAGTKGFGWFEKGPSTGPRTTPAASKKTTTTTSTTTTSTTTTTLPVYTVRVAASGRTKIVVEADGTVVFDDIVTADEAPKEFRGTRVLLTIGRPSVAEIAVNGQPRPAAEQMTIP